MYKSKILGDKGGRGGFRMKCTIVHAQFSVSPQNGLKNKFLHAQRPGLHGLNHPGLNRPV